MLYETASGKDHVRNMRFFETPFFPQCFCTLHNLEENMQASPKKGLTIFPFFGKV